MLKEQTLMRHATPRNVAAAAASRHGWRLMAHVDRAPIIASPIEVYFNRDLMAILENHGFTFRPAEVGKSIGRVTELTDCETMKADEEADRGHAMLGPKHFWTLDKKNRVKFGVRIDVRQSGVKYSPYFHSSFETAMSPVCHERLYKTIVEFGPRGESEKLTSIYQLGLRSDSLEELGYRQFEEVFTEFVSRNKVVKDLAESDKSPFTVKKGDVYMIIRDIPEWKIHWLTELKAYHAATSEAIELFLDPTG